VRFRTALSLTTLFLFCFTFAVWATPLDAQNPVKTEPPEVDNVSGEIISVGDLEFSSEVRQNQQQTRVRYLIDARTKLEGELSIGSQATVEYRSEDGNNSAIHIYVLPASGMQSR
jgi:hypothetical protein